MCTTSQLSEIVREYYPSNVSWESDEHHSTEQALRRVAACRQAQSNREPFRAVLRALETQYPGHWVGEEGNIWLDPSVAVRVSAGRHDPNDDKAIYVVGCISLLAPVYMTYAAWGAQMPGASGLAYECDETSAAVWNGIHRTFEEHFKVEYVPPDVGLTVVPDLDNGSRQFGEATLYDLLFTSHRW